MSKMERDALLDVSKDSTVPVCPAGKGGAIVLQRASDYEKEIRRQLDEHVFFFMNALPATNKLKTCLHSMFSKRVNLVKTSVDFLK